MNLFNLSFGKSYSIAVVLGGISTLIAGVIKIVRVPIIVSALGPSVYGFWITLLGLSALALSFEYVMTSVVTREISLADEWDKTKRFSHSLAIKVSCRSIYLKYSLLFTLLVAFSLSALIIITEPPVLIHDRLFAVIVVSISSGIYLYSTIFTAVLDGIGDVWVGKLTRLFFEISGFILIILGLSVTDDFKVLLVAYFFQSLFFAGLNYTFYRSMTKSYKVTLSDKANIFEAMNQRVLALSSVQAGALLYILAPTILIPIFFDYEVAAAFSVVAQLCQLGPYILMPVISAYLPRLVNEVKAGDVRLYIRLSFVILSVIYLLYGFLYINIETILFYWVGPELFVSNIFVLVIVLLSVFELSYLIMRQIFICINDNTSQIDLARRSILVFVMITAGCLLVLMRGNSHLIYVFLPSLVTLIFVMNGGVAVVISKHIRLLSYSVYCFILLFLVLIISLSNYLKLLLPLSSQDIWMSSILLCYVAVALFYGVGMSGFREIISSFKSPSDL